MTEHNVDLTENLGASMVGTCIALLVLSWIAVGLRTYTRAILMKSFQIDDWLMLVAQLIFTLTCAMVIEGVNKGMGKHNAAITNEDDRVAALMWQALATAIYILDMMFIKLSIGIFLLRLAVGKVYKYILMVSLVVIALWSLGIFFWDVFQCNPVAKQWDFRIDHGHCASADEIISAAYALSVMTVLSDWLYALLPIPMLWSVKMTKQAKATVIVILGLGIFASIATLIRLKFLNGLQESDDLLYTATDAMIWTVVEPGVAIIASSLATIRPLLRAMRVSGFTSTDRTPSTGVSGGGRYGQNSRNTATRSMPGFGPNDVSLHQVGYGTESRQANYQVKGAAAGLTFDEFHKQAMTGGQATDEVGHHDAKSEVYVIEGSKNSPTWSSHDLHPTNRSLEDFHDLEEQSQGLGISSRAR
ncbi:hypothetical protein JDV02_005277 [Purpureocillium takamizusanense]|uniref:Rhodopsin domain-containing protein n=1 Tax=Purpureocillium takamizusanense TaxID=2060973 RepID=A0A9Q8QG57_9HYPO|nr:uncharacterized protein JDV02_005277 [Purpureocillium takamizusanense]UNI19060.1 hypothetical protein JDV02_005277 [Purpureocillium takamizusanense]